MIATVVYVVHVRTPYEHIPKLFIKGVPKGTSEQEVKEVLEENGYWFGEFGSRWANHYILLGISDAHPQVKGAWKRGDVEVVEWQKLTKTDWEKVDKENQ